MQVSRTLDYAVRSLIYMGNHENPRIGMREISEAQHIPQNYLAKIMRRLVERGLIRSMVGPEGGYFLRKDPKDINLRHIYEAVEGEIRVIDCMDQDEVCALYENCTQLPVWDKLKVSMIKLLENTSLEDLLTESGANTELLKGEEAQTQ
jgi:Rrf2 family protein